MKRDNIKLMEVCGTHTMAIARFGIKKILPKGIDLISGPGCPVCVTSQEDIDKAVKIASDKDVIMTTFGDMMRVPGSSQSLVGVKRSGGDVRIVYSCLDALGIAEDNPGKKIVFMGVGFETTAPTVASTILEARKRGLRNFSVLSKFKVIFPALSAIASSPKVKVAGFICPGHVSVITGLKPYEDFVRKYKIPCVVTGFEERDIISGILRLVELIKDDEFKAEISYKRAVERNGNVTARKVLARVLKADDAVWRGIGKIPKSGLTIRREFSQFDADKIFNIKVKNVKDPKGCMCGEVLQGIKSPSDCGLFKKVCTPENPIGPCMVSSEGTCAAYYRYG